jgi:hypothetical protein
MKSLAIVLLISSIIFAAAVFPASAGKMNGNSGCSHPGCTTAQFGQPNSAGKQKNKAVNSNKAH